MRCKYFKKEKLIISISLFKSRNKYDFFTKTDELLNNIKNALNNN